MSATADAYMFKEILAEMREHSLMRLDNSHLGSFVPSKKLYDYYKYLRSLPVPTSNDDELDDAVHQLKDSGNQGATTTANDTQAGVTDATNTYQATQNPNDFHNKMEESRKKAPADSAKSINDSYDKGEKLGEKLPPDQQNVILTLMDTLNDGFHQVWDKIKSFIQDAVGAVMKWLAECWAKITEFFGDLGGVIASIF